ncbi:MAG: citramalate synthase [Acidimicrobiales bacterium]|nr:citramalate synthase [Acidimicrobiales bacterium]
MSSDRTSGDRAPDDPAPPVDRSPVYQPEWPKAVEIFDTTLRDGAQFEGISLTVNDKLRVAEQLDSLGVHWIEGGWPGANPKDEEFFDRAQRELDFSASNLVAFGMTRRPQGKVDVDETLANLLGANTETVCIVGKSWDYHVTQALRATLDEGVAMVRESVEFLKAAGRRVFFDAEHFFDGYRRNPEFTLRVLEAAAMGGADCLVLCDTNGGSLPHDVESTVREVVEHFSGTQVGMHTQNDTGCALANAVAGVRAGATHVQGTMNGYGERTGNCDLTALVPNLTLKMGIETLPEGRIERLTVVSHAVAEIVNLAPQPQQPYVGASAFAHKAGLHTSAIARRPDSYEHIAPQAVGNDTRFLVSDLGGRSTLALKGEEFGVDLDGAQLGELSDKLKQLEHAGYFFEAAEASLELLMREAQGWVQPFFELESYRTSVDHRSGSGARVWNDVDADLVTEAVVKLRVGPERLVAVGEGNGPVNALDDALRKALNGRYPGLSDIHLVDYKVRVLNSGSGTGAVTRVLLDSTNGQRSWTTIGVSANVIEASWQALVDSIVFGLLQAA